MYKFIIWMMYIYLFGEMYLNPLFHNLNPLCVKPCIGCIGYVSVVNKVTIILFLYVVSISISCFARYGFSKEGEM